MQPIIFNIKLEEVTLLDSNERYLNSGMLLLLNEIFKQGYNLHASQAPTSRQPVLPHLR